jgi:hypothetical protein
MEEVVNGINAQTVNPQVKPEFGPVQDGFNQVVVMPVEVGLALQKISNYLGCGKGD